MGPNQIYKLCTAKESVNKMKTINTWTERKYLQMMQSTRDSFPKDTNNSTTATTKKRWRNWKT